MQPEPSHSAETLPPAPAVPPPPSGSKLTYQVTPDGITVRSAPPPPLAAAALCSMILFVPAVFWICAYASRNRPPFTMFLILVLVAIACSFLCTSSLFAFFRRLRNPPEWHAGGGQLVATKSGTLFRKRIHFDRSQIITVRGHNGNLHVITQRTGHWRVHRFPLLTYGSRWLAEVVGTTLGLAPLPNLYVMTRTPTEGSPDQLTYGIDGASPRLPIATTGVRATAPEGDPPADAVIQIRRDGDAWTVTRPASGPVERLLIWAALGGMAFLSFLWIARTYSHGPGAAIPLLIGWFAFWGSIRDRFSRTCGPTALAFQDDSLHLARPTGWGMHRQTIHWWMIRTIELKPTVRRGRPWADLHLLVKNGGRIPLFTSLPERDARWVAALIAGSLAMEEAEPTWGIG